MIALLRTSLFIALIALINSCESPDISSDELTFSDFVGVYKANFGSSQIDQIEFRADSTFVHSYQAPDSELAADSGSFKFLDYGRNRYQVYIEGLAQFHPAAEWCRRAKPIGSGLSERTNFAASVIKLKSKIYVQPCVNEAKYYVRTQ